MSTKMDNASSLEFLRTEAPRRPARERDWSSQDCPDRRSLQLFNEETTLRASLSLRCRQLQAEHCRHGFRETDAAVPACAVEPERHGHLFAGLIRVQRLDSDLSRDTLDLAAGPLCNCRGHCHLVAVR